MSTKVELYQIWMSKLKSTWADEDSIMNKLDEIWYSMTEEEKQEVDPARKEKLK